MDRKEIGKILLYLFESFGTPDRYDIDRLGKWFTNKIEVGREKDFTVDYLNDYFNRNFENKIFIKFFTKRVLKFFKDFNLDISKEEYFFSISYQLLRKAKEQFFNKLDYYTPVSQFNCDLFGINNGACYEDLPTFPKIEKFLDELFEEYEYLLSDNNIPSKEYEKLLKRSKEMSGRPLVDDKRKTYEDILKIQKELSSKYGSRAQKSSLLNSVRTYKIRYKLTWSDRKIKSTAETIRQLLEKKSLVYPK